MSCVNDIVDKLINNQRINFDESLMLYEKADFLTLGDLAHKKRMTRHPEHDVTFVIDRNINYTNVCVSGCRFCAFYRSKHHADAYVISENDLFQKIQETIQLGGTQILIQGGMHPDLNLTYYLNLLQFIKTHFPTIHIHGFSPPEIFFIAQKEKRNIQDIIFALHQAGLDSIPGGGAEILCDDIRNDISPNKCMSDAWLNVMKSAHHIGMKSSATMMFGHIEKPNHIVSHLIKIRSLQDETNGFTAFIPWTFQPQNTTLSVKTKTAAEYLKVLALSRLILDNVSNIQASWVTQGAKIAQFALFFGANDLGSTMIEENVVAAAGVNFRLPLKEMIRLIHDAGFTPKQRNCYYQIVKTYG